MTSTILFRCVAWLLVAAVAFVTLSPISQRPITPAPADFERFLAYAAIGGAFSLGYPKHRFGIMVVVIGIVGLLELAQHLTPGRHGRLHDAVFKAAGAFFGAAVAMIVDRRKATP
jgi:VanZ family protein